MRIHTKSIPEVKAVFLHDALTKGLSHPKTGMKRAKVAQLAGMLANDRRHLVGEDVGRRQVACRVS